MGSLRRSLTRRAFAVYDTRSSSPRPCAVTLVALPALVKVAIAGLVTTPTHRLRTGYANIGQLADVFPQGRTDAAAASPDPRARNEPTRRQGDPAHSDPPAYAAPTVCETDVRPVRGPGRQSVKRCPAGAQHPPGPSRQSCAPLY
jgi:hypothetical protein